MDSTLLTLLALASQSMTMFANFMDLAAKGQLTEADIATMQALVKSHVDGFQAIVDAKKP